MIKDWRVFVVLGLQLIIFVTLIYPENIQNQALAYDIKRDLAFVHHLLSGGGWLEDPTIMGEHIWYPPLSPIVVAAISYVSNFEPWRIYSWGLLFLNLIIPVALYLLVKSLCNVRVAFFSALFLVFSPWLKTHVYVLSMPSIHGILFVLVGLLLFDRWYRTNKGIWLTGAFCGLALMHHSLSGLILYGTIFCQIFLSHLEGRKYTRIEFLALLTVPVFLWLPYLVPNFASEKLNMAPLEYLAPELKNRDYPLHFGNAYLCVALIFFGAVGIWKRLSDRNKQGLSLLEIGFAISLIGQLPGYMRLLSVWWPETFKIFSDFPILVPHEFQWFSQLFFIPFVTIGFIYSINKYGLSKPAWQYAAAILLASPIYYDLYKEYPEFRKVNHGISPSIQWVRENTSVHDVVLCSSTGFAYHDVAAKTGRKMLYVGAAHMNYNVDVKSRELAARDILRSKSPSDVNSLIGYYRVDYALFRKSEISRSTMALFRQNYVSVFEDSSEIIFDVRKVRSTLTDASKLQQSKSLSDLSIKFDEGEHWNAKGVYIFRSSVLNIALQELSHSKSIALMADQNDSYVLTFSNMNKEYAKTLHVPIVEGQGGLRSRQLSIPRDIYTGGFDKIKIEPLVGDGRYSVGYVSLN